MGKLGVFLFTSLDGYYKDANGTTEWHKHGGEDEGKLSDEGAQSGNTLVFGRVTYEMMAGFWPSPMAHEMFPTVADGMNKADKIVFSKKLKKAEWPNTKIISGDMVKEMKKLKQSSNSNFTILGSGSVVTQLSDAGLIDDYMFLVDPIAIGEGTSMFQGLTKHLNLKLVSSKAFKSGAVLNNYIKQ